MFITGCSWGHPGGGTSSDYGCQYTYDIEANGTGASTTGTIYGIYDMSGGSWEYVMANYNEIIGNSGFESMPEPKYYDKYTSNDVLTACNGNECFSHGLSEISGWYNDYNTMITDAYPWLLHGSYYGNPFGGVFGFSHTGIDGRGSINNSFRLALVL